MTAAALIRGTLPAGALGSKFAPGAGDAIRLWRSIAAAHAHLAERLDAEPGTCHVLGSDTVAVLLPLAAAPGQRLRMHELAERSHLTRSGLTRRVDRLEAAGLVQRTACAADRRAAYAELTHAGRAELAMALAHHASALERLVASRLGVPDTQRLVALLDRLAGVDGSDVSSNR